VAVNGQCGPGDGSLNWRDALRDFGPARANLPEIERDSVSDYLSGNAASRPWLASARSESPDVQFIFTALDAGNGHLLQRHGPWLAPETVRLRVGELRDPAIVRTELRLPGADAYARHTHACGTEATWFTDQVALAACFVTCVEHPRVRRRLDQPFDPARTPSPTRIPLDEALGPDGHLHIDGYRLAAAGADQDRARRERDAWVHRAMRRPAEAGPPPEVVRISDFAGGAVLVAFRPDAERRRYEIATMYGVPPRPPYVRGTAATARPA
jgi:hypothetical protein